VHKAVASTIEAIHSDKLDEHSPLLAHHWEAAGQSLIAARWHARAAEWVGTSDVGASARHWQSARALAGEAGDEAEAARIGGLACRKLLGLAFRLGMAREELDALFEEGRGCTQQSADKDEAALVHNAYAIALITQGAVEASLPHSRQAEALMRQARDEELRALAPWGTAYHLFVVGPVPTAIAKIEELAEATRAHMDWGLATFA
jgi:adenylate cyclase